MLLKLQVKNLKNADYQEEFRFERMPVNIGRETKNEIVLADLMKLVSRQHAKIIFNDENFQLVDQLSRNFTFLNDTKLDPETEYQLNVGDKIKIGEFSIDVLEIKKDEIESDDSQKTMIFSSPFADSIGELAACLEKMSEKYSMADEQLRDEYLRMDMHSKFLDLHFEKIGHIISEYFSEKYPVKTKHKEEKYPPIEPKFEVPVQETPVKPAPPSVNKSNVEFTLNSQFSNAFDVLLESATKLIQGFWHFRQEFFGVTIYQSMPTTSVEKLKEFLFDPAISNDESDKRLELFSEELGKILSHQVGLLDGYKYSIDEGVSNLLEELDPVLLENKLKEEKIKIGKYELPVKFIPLYTKIKLMRAIKDEHKKLKLDTNVVERKQFRPAFMKGYQKRSLPGKETE